MLNLPHVIKRFSYCVWMIFVDSSDAPKRFTTATHICVSLFCQIILTLVTSAGSSPCINVHG